MLETKIIAYAAPVTEVEFGWGARSDGYVIAATKAEIQEARERAIAHAKIAKFDYDVIEKEFTLFITEETKTLLETRFKEHGKTLFDIDNGQLEKYGKKA